MNMDQKTHRFLTMIMYINYLCSYVVIGLFNDQPLLPWFFLTINLVISTISHRLFYSHRGVDNKAKIVLILQMMIVFALLYFDRSTYELLFVFLFIGDAIFAFGYRFSISYTIITYLALYPFNYLIYQRSMGYPYADVATRDIVIIIFVTIILFISRMQINEKMKYNRVLAERNSAYKELQHYTERIEEVAVHEERSRIAYMLHNSIGHKLVAINLSLQAEKMELVKVGALQEDHFSSVENQINDAMSLLRRTIENSDDFIATLSINELIEMFISNLQNYTSIDLQYDIHTPTKIPSKYNSIIYNVLLESVTNVLKHANCTKVWITIHSQDLITITIKDNGQGFSELHAGFGISQLQKKIANHHGEYSIASENSCSVRVTLPLEEL